MKHKVTYLCWLLLACLLLAACQPASDSSPIDTQPDTAPESTETGDNETGGNETGDNETEPETDPLPEDVLVLFKTLHVNDKHISGEVAADTSSFSFEDEVVLAKNVVYSVSTDPDGNIIIPSKTV